MLLISSPKECANLLNDLPLCFLRAIHAKMNQDDVQTLYVGLRSLVVLVCRVGRRVAQAETALVST